MGGFGLIFLAVIVLAVVAAVVWQIAATRRDLREFPAPGRMVDVEGARIHAQIAGAGAPAIVFEAGIAATGLSWKLVQAEAAEFGYTISYDRAGLGWSDAVRGRCDVESMVQNLHALLEGVSAPRPRILVGHSFGGLIVMAYAARFPDEVAGVVLVDPAGAGEWAEPTAANRAMLARGIFLSRVGEVLAHLGVVRGALNLAVRGSATIPRMVARASSGRGGAAFTERMVGEVRKLPREAWKGVQLHWSDPKCFRASARHLQSLPEMARVALGASIQAPLIVLSAGNASAAQRADHERIAREARQGRLEVVEDSGHWILLDRPEVVVGAIRELAANERR